MRAILHQHASAGVIGAIFCKFYAKSSISETFFPFYFQFPESFANPCMFLADNSSRGSKVNRHD
jgi:hypothetical protein